ncbi:MAG: hypothetical protein H6622_08505 [Halobacteriovoraceae bacterium]|nr:hypothetical protein [Halobacteriovoraceae bacterium]
MRNFYLIVFVTIQISTIYASDLTGYFQSDFNISENHSAPSGFRLRRINLIYAKKVLENAKILTDIEFEDGLELGTNGGIGEIKISRGYGELIINKNMEVRAGKFLTPYGIYNEIHDFSASYVPIDPPLFFRKNLFFSNTSSQRAISKYSTGILINFNHKKFHLQGGVANGEQQKEDGSDQNRSPLTLIRMTYEFWDQAWIGMSFQRDKINTSSRPRWENSFAFDLQFEGQQYIFQTEFFQGKKWNRTTGVQSTNYQSVSTLLGHNLNDDFIGYIRYDVFIPDITKSENNTQEYGMGLNYFVNYYTIIKWESYQESLATSWVQKKDYLTHKLSLSIVY